MRLLLFLGVLLLNYRCQEAIVYYEKCPVASQQYKDKIKLAGKDVFMCKQSMSEYQEKYKDIQNQFDQELRSTEQDQKLLCKYIDNLVNLKIKSFVEGQELFDKQLKIYQQDYSRIISVINQKVQHHLQTVDSQLKFIVDKDESTYQQEFQKIHYFKKSLEQGISHIKTQFTQIMDKQEKLQQILKEQQKIFKIIQSRYQKLNDIQNQKFNEIFISGQNTSNKIAVCQQKLAHIHSLKKWVQNYQDDQNSNSELSIVLLIMNLMILVLSIPVLISGLMSRNIIIYRKKTIEYDIQDDDIGSYDINNDSAYISKSYPNKTVDLHNHTQNID